MKLMNTSQRFIIISGLAALACSAFPLIATANSLPYCSEHLTTKNWYIKSYLTSSDLKKQSELESYLYPKQVLLTYEVDGKKVTRTETFPSYEKAKISLKISSISLKISLDNLINEKASVPNFRLNQDASGKYSIYHLYKGKNYREDSFSLEYYLGDKLWETSVVKGHISERTILIGIFSSLGKKNAEYFRGLVLDKTGFVTGTKRKVLFEFKFKINDLLDIKRKALIQQSSVILGEKNKKCKTIYIDPEDDQPYP